MVHGLSLLLISPQGPAVWKAKAEAFLAKEQFQPASEAFLKAADAYDKLGDPNAGKVLRERGNRYGSKLEIYTAEPVTQTKLARGEPASGMYLGANIEREDATRYPQSFNNLIGKRHAMFFMYRKYGVGFPVAFARDLKKAGAALQIAWEPGSLSEVRDDRYLQQFAKDVRESGIPVFVRFASEMNGSWTPYHGNPALYREKFRLVADVVRAIAPNAIMVWCPNTIPEQPIPDYYPGPEAVDWVGVNFYSVIYNDSDRSRAADWRFPTDSLDYIYNRYSAAHPIMVAEWAASHRASIDGADKPSFATQKIAEFFRTVPLRYPRLKAASWLSFNALKYAKGDRQLNNYSLLDNPAVAEGYKNAIADPHFLSVVGSSAPVAWRAAPSVVARRVKCRVWIRSYDPFASVSASFGVGASKRLEMGSEFEVPADAKFVKLDLKDSNGRAVLSRQISVK